MKSNHLFCISSRVSYIHRRFSGCTRPSEGGFYNQAESPVPEFQTSSQRTDFIDTEISHSHGALFYIHHTSSTVRATSTAKVLDRMIPPGYPAFLPNLLEYFPLLWDLRPGFKQRAGPCRIPWPRFAERGLLVGVPPLPLPLRCICNTDRSEACSFFYSPQRCNFAPGATPERFHVYNPIRKPKGARWRL